MSAYHIADSAQLSILTKVLDDYCSRHPAECRNERDREEIAHKVMGLFCQGIENAEDLTAAIERVS